GVADERHVLEGPALVAHRREAPPDGAALEELLAFELSGEEAFTKGDGGVLVGVAEARAAPGLFRGLDDEGAVLVVETVGVDAPEAVRIFLEEESEGVE